MEKSIFEGPETRSLIPRLFFLAFFTIALNSHADGLQKRIGQIKIEKHNASNKKQAIAKAEAQYLALLNEFNKPEEKGRIYVALSHLGGYGLEKEKSQKYAKEALKYPLDILVACGMYSTLGDYQGGLKFVDRYLKISVKQDVPLVMICDTPDDNDPCWKQHRASLAAHDEAILQNSLLLWHDLFVKGLSRKH